MYITSIELNGLWGVKSYNLKLNRDFNFLIGPNGSGKTTLLTLVTSIIELDIDTLSRIDFYECTISFSNDTQNSKLCVLKGDDSNGDSLINYIISNSDTDEPHASDIFKCRGNERHENPNDYFVLGRHKRKYLMSEQLTNFTKQLSMTWLPIGRGNPASFEYDRTVNNSVDYRLGVVSDSFVKYISVINQTVSERMNYFQKDIFLSAIDFTFVDQIKNRSTSFDTKKEKDILIEAFKEVGIKESMYQKKINKMFNIINEIERKRNAKKNLDLTFEEIIWIFNTWKSHYLVEKYNEYKFEKNKINESIDSFIKILNDLFEGRKTFFVSKSNELCAYSPDGYEIKLNDLSSGEKQLLIILGEALLQNGNRCLYVADEPELSLHVTWQEKLVNSIIKINKNAQIIFATHSPDIVSWRSNKTIAMEEI